jgi:thiol-disulfide isomerase/thioredoxin
MIFFYETKTITFVLQKMIMTENLTKQTFLEKVFNYEKNKDWMYEGKLPVLEELSNEYAGKINIYKVDTEAEQELAAAFAIRSIPSMLFIPMNEQPQMANGALPKQELQKLIKEVLKVEI